jgi:hypothetical protein
MKILLLVVLLVSSLIPSTFGEKFDSGISISLAESYERNDWLNIKGVAKSIPEGEAIVLSIYDPDNRSMISDKVIVDRFGQFGFITQMSGKLWAKDGIYTVKIQYLKSIIEEKFTLGSQKILIPDWVKSVADFWVANQIADDEFIQAIQYLIKIKIIEVPLKSLDSNIKTTGVPAWIKNTAGFWVDGQVSDTEFASALQYLIKIGVLKIPPPTEIKKGL